MAGKPLQPAAMGVPRGHYSPGYQVGNLLYISGQLPVRAGQAPDAGMPFDEQVRVVLGNVQTIVEAAGGSLADIAKVTVYVTDVELWGEFNALYAGIFGAHRPARVVVPVPTLHYGLKLEVEAIAHLAG